MPGEQPTESLESEAEFEAQLLKESLGAGLAVAAIFAGSSQAGTYPVPSPLGAEDAAAELALIPERGHATRTAKQAKAQASPANKTVKLRKAKKAKRVTSRGADGGRPRLA